MTDIDFLKEKVKSTKIRMLEMCLKGGYGHPSSAYSCVEAVTVLYYSTMKYDVNSADDADRDRFVMSKNHASVILFPILNDVGYISDAEFADVEKIGGKITYHTNIHHRGMEFSGGALGIGLGYSAGLAKAAKLSGKSWLTFCVVGDAETQEGSIWEAVMFASHNKLGNLIVIVDNNKRGVSDHTSNLVSVEPIEDRWSAFGWETRRINGHSIEQLLSALSDVRTRDKDVPLCIIADTVKGHGIDFMADKELWHGRLPKGENEIQSAFEQLRNE